MNVVTIAMGKGKEEIMGIYLNPSTENFGNLGLSHNGASLLEQPSTKTIKSEAILKCRNKNAIRENGMTNCDFKSIDDLKDPVSHFVYDLLCSYRIPRKLAFSFIKYGARDHARVPMQWDDSINAGFNKGTRPWQCVNPSYKVINAKNDLDSDKSIYRYYQKLLAIKKGNDTAIYGEMEEYDHDNRQVIAYCRQYLGNRLFVIGNFSKRQALYTLPSWLQGAEVLLSNESLEKDGLALKLKPYQAIVFEKLPINKK